MHTAKIFIESDNSVWLKDLSDGAGYVNDAVVVGSLLDGTRTPLTGANAVSMSYVPSSNGWYKGNFPNTLILSANQHLILRVVATKGSLKLTLEEPAIADYYRGTR